MSNELNAEDLEYSLADSALVQLIAYSVLNRQNGKGNASEMISNTSDFVWHSRQTEGGKVRLDKITKDAITVGIDTLIMVLEDIVEELEDEQSTKDVYLNKETYQ